MNYYIFALLTAFLFGVAPILGKWGLEGVNPALALCIWSFIISAIMLGWATEQGHKPFSGCYYGQLGTYSFIRNMYSTFRPIISLLCT